jgi:hypothetical protein
MTNEPPPAILSQDFETASQALDESIWERDADSVRLPPGPHRPTAGLRHTRARRLNPP